MIKYITVVFVFLFSMNTTSTQIPAPRLYCISSDTLQWETPTVNCGRLEGFDVYMAKDRQGPYTLIETINNASITTTFYNNPAGETRYYYMQSKADCPGEMPTNSDTLDNLIPPEIEISYVTVENGDVKIVWEAPQTSEELRYRIFRSTRNGTIIVGEVTQQHFFIDTDATPDEQPEYYYVVSVDACNNQGLYTENHSTINISAWNIIGCERIMALTANPYIGWKDNVEEYRVMVSQNSGSFTVNGFYDKIEDAKVVGILDNKTYRIRIDAVHKNTQWISSSQVIEVTPDFSQPIYLLSLVHATYINGNQLQVTWEWNADAEIVNAQLNIKSSSFSDHFPITPTNNAQNNYATQIISLPSDIEKPVNISLTVVDACDNTMNSDETFFLLRGHYVNRQSINLSWNSYFYNPASIPSQFQFNVNQRGILEDKFEVVNSGEDMHTYIYSPQFSVDEGELCFQFSFPYTYTSEITGKDTLFITQSNVECVTPESIVHFPNAIAPKSKNNIFKPKGLFFEQLETYSLSIFTREGNKIFESNDIEEGWNGLNDGRPVPGGVYIYVASYVEKDQLYTVKGIVNVMY